MVASIKDIQLLHALQTDRRRPDPPTRPCDMSSHRVWLLRRWMGSPRAFLGWTPLGAGFAWSVLAHEVMVTR